MLGKSFSLCNKQFIIKWVRSSALMMITRDDDEDDDDDQDINEACANQQWVALSEEVVEVVAFAEVGW